KYSKEELKNEMDSNNWSFLHVINPEFYQKSKSKPNSFKRFKKVKNKFRTFINKGIFIEEKSPSLYIYRQSKEKYEHIGIIGCASIDDYLENRIKKHEQTLSQRENILRSYLEVTDINAEPVLLTYSDDIEIEKLMLDQMKEKPLYDFETKDDKIKHQLWVINDKSLISKFQKQFEHLSSIYIADGHHRCASSVLYGKEMREKYPEYSGKEGFNYFMAYFIPRSKLTVHGHGRGVVDLNGYSKQGFLDEVSKRFMTGSVDQKLNNEGDHNILMYLLGEWFTLSPKKGYLNTEDPKESLDSQILAKYLLKPILGIEDLRTDKRMKYAGGNSAAREMQQKVDEGEISVGFVLNPVTIDQVMNVSDAGKTMPPKTTWVEPKLRSGVTIYRMYP
ncbi:MAG: DUF1015 domain-containing protein, partial [Flavobacteriales bacterium]